MQVTCIKKDAQVSIVLHSGIIQELQTALMGILNGHTEEEIAAIKGKDILEPWESTVVALTRLLQMIQQSAKESGQTVTRDLADVITEVTS